MESEWSLESLRGVALVTVQLRNPTAVDRRVRVTNRLDGPLLPPRRRGVPEPGWDDEGFEGVVPAEGRRALGYACPADPTTPPIEVVDEGRDEAARSRTERALRELGDPRPPADAVTSGTGTPLPRSDADEADADSTPGPRTDADPVDDWLATVERRIERGERLTDASVTTATTALDGDVDAATVDERIAADARALRAFADRADALAERAAAVDVPVAALRRLS
jgi:hypothetical protein